MAVFADPDEGHINRCCGQLASNFFGDTDSVTLHVEQVISANSCLGDEPLEQVLTETCGMIDRQADVLVQMKHLDVAPVDIAGSRECREEIQL
jgi:hypothetical protein